MRRLSSRSSETAPGTDQDARIWDLPVGPGGGMKQVVCLKWGHAYSAEDVNILYGMVSRNVTGPVRFYCLTDDARGIRPEVICRPIPDVGCELPDGVPGKWRKTVLWSPDLGGIRGPVLFLDLDVVIVANIDGYFLFGRPDDVIVARNWVNPLRRTGQTSVMRFQVGQHTYMLEELRRHPIELPWRYLYEQNFVTDRIRGGVRYWPEPWTRHFRLHCVAPWPLRFFRPPSLPRQSRIIAFPGSHPKPRDAVRGRWSDEQVSLRFTDHLAASWRRLRAGDPDWRHHAGHFLLPARWVAENWRA